VNAELVGGRNIVAVAGDAGKMIDASPASVLNRLDILCSSAILRIHDRALQTSGAS